MTRTEFTKYMAACTAVADRKLGMSLAQLAENPQYDDEQRDEKRQAHSKIFFDHWKETFPEIPKGWKYNKAED